MAIRNANPRDRGQSVDYFRYRRKADQEWELGGLARQDGDLKAMEEHYAKAREYGAMANELRSE